MKNNNVIEIIKQGGVVIMPTDTIYGIVGDATNEKTIKRVFELKKRDGSKAMLMLVSDIDMLKEYVDDISEEEMIKQIGEICENMFGED